MKYFLFFLFLFFQFYNIKLSKQQCLYLAGIDFNVNNLPNSPIEVKSIDECKLNFSDCFILLF